MHINLIYSEIRQKEGMKTMYLHSRLNFLFTNTHDAPGEGGIIFITYTGRMRIPSSIVEKYSIA